MSLSAMSGRIFGPGPTFSLLASTGLISLTGGTKSLLVVDSEDLGNFLFAMKEGWSE